MMNPAPQDAQNRLIILDLLRGLAIIAMVIFHLTWDLEFFGILERGFTLQPEWKLFARSIAASFLFLAGFSLILGHGKKLRPRPFIIRFAKIAGAALIISLATFYATPEAPIFFGILHAIAAFSVIGLVCKRLHWALLLLLAILTYFAPYYLRSDVFNHVWLWWVGLSLPPPQSNDYVPFLPWFAPFLVGMACAKLATLKGWLAHLGHLSIKPAAFANILAFMGRHSLLIYLVHQPILMGIIWLSLTIA